MRALPVSVLVLCSVLLASLSCFSQEGTDPVEQARSHMERGQILYVQGRYIEAAEEFMRAFEFQPYSAFLFNGAVAYERFGDAVRAADLFARYLEHDPEAADRADVTLRIERLRAIAPPDQEGPQTQQSQQIGQQDGDTTSTEVAAATVDATPPPENVEGMKSLLSVQTNPSGAQITVRRADGTVVATGPSPFVKTLDRGTYTVTADHPDFRTSQTEPIDFTAGVVHILRVELAQGAFLGFLRVVSTVPGSSVLIDERQAGPVGRTPFSDQLPVGNHRIWIERPGYRPIEQQVEITLARPVTIRITQERVNEGRLDIRGNVRGAKVYVDAHLSGRTPMVHEALAGPHIIWVEAEGYKAWEGTVTLRQGQVTRVDVTMHPAISRTPGYIAGGFALAVFGAATLAGLHANGIDDELAADRTLGRQASNDPRIFEGFLWSLGADAGFLLGGIIGIFSLYYFLRDPYEDSLATQRRPIDFSFAPLLGPGSAGLSLGGAL